MVSIDENETDVFHHVYMKHLNSRDLSNLHSIILSRFSLCPQWGWRDPLKTNSHYD